jgi:hypothetical protein
LDIPAVNGDRGDIAVKFVRGCVDTHPADTVSTPAARVIDRSSTVAADQSACPHLSKGFAMKAVTWHGKRDVRVDTVPAPKVEVPTDAIIEVTSTTFVDPTFISTRYSVPS